MENYSKMKNKFEVFDKFSPGCIIVLYVVFWFFCRLLKIGVTQRMIYASFILTFLLLICNLIFNKKINLWYGDLIWLILIGIMIIHKNQEYDFNNILIIIAGYILSLACRNNLSYMKCIIISVALFSIINYVVNIISLIDINMYEKLINKYMSTLYSKEAIGSTKYGYITGLAEHYSRNAYFCVAGLSVFFSLAFAGKNKKIFYIMSIAELIMIMRIGKRGHLLFAVLTIVIVIIFAEPKLSKKGLRLLQLFLAATIILIIINEFLPEVGFVFKRIADLSKTTDSSQGRFKAWKQAMTFFAQNPIIGIGYGGFTVESKKYLGMLYAGVHNDYIQWLCEEGIIGFVLNAYLGISIYIVTIKEYKVLVADKSKEGNIQQILITWSLFFQTFVLTYSLTGLPHYDYEINTIYILACTIPIAFLWLYECRGIGIKGKNVRIK